MSPAPKRPWRMFLPFGLVVLLFILWSGYWWFAESYVMKAAAEQRARLAGQRIDLACASESWGGYPFRFEFSCKEPRLTLPGGRSVAATAVLAVAQAYNPTHVILLIDGPTLARDPAQGDIAIGHGRAIVSLRIISAGGVEASAEVPDVNIPKLGSAGMLRAFARPAKSGATDVAITADNLIVTPPGKPPLAADKAQLVGRLTSSFYLEISDISASKGDLKVWGKGGLAVDPSHRLEGKLTTETNDLNSLFALIDPLLDMTGEQRATLKMVLGLLGKQARTEVTARNGELFVGPMKVGDLLPVF
ncbi:MAG: DUF2125 domain-containing protein [Rhizobiales bacterium]|nr:DUF2125 domain-containing protein [Hyphomicrobiales bacterium]MBI3672115.1 DUF2125 domain-containing protein [Hyphomicrobiales bacterium]